MDTSYRRVKKTLQIGFGVTGASLLVGVVFAPLLVFAAAALIATAVTAGAISSTSTHRWTWTWAAGIASTVWVSSAIYAVDLWGQAFNLSDANQPVSPTLSYIIAGSFILSIVAFIAILVSATFSAIRARQLDPRNRIRYTRVKLGAGTASTVSITAPFSRTAQAEVFDQPGVASYENGNGTSTVTVTHTDNSIAFNTIIWDASAPGTYTYSLDPPSDSTLHQNANGAT